VEPNPLRRVDDDVEARGTPAAVADLPLSGTDPDGVAEVPRRENIGHRAPLLVRVHDDDREL
jgi:hypothetical protein